MLALVNVRPRVLQFSPRSFLQARRCSHSPCPLHAPVCHFVCSGSNQPSGLSANTSNRRIARIPKSRSGGIWGRSLCEPAFRTKNGPKYLLNGFLVCGQCGDLMYSHSNRKADYYHCKRNGTRERAKGKGCESTYVLAKKIEAKIEELLAERLQERAFLTRVAEAFISRAKVLSFPEIAVDVEARIEKLKRKRERISEDY